MSETNENKINFSEIDFSAFQKNIFPLSNEKTSLLALDEELRKFDISNLSETEISIIELFRKISSIMLTDDTSNPFTPRLQLAKGARTCMPEDITETEMDFFISILDKTANKMLKARMADILWVRKYKKKIDYPKIVISTYLSIGFDELNFFENLLFWKRGLYLASQIKDSESIVVFSNKSIDFLFNTSFNNDACFLRFVEMLRCFKLCFDNSTSMIEHLIQWGEELQKSNNFFLAEQYYNEASLWTLQTQKDCNKYTELQIKRVSTYIDAAEKTENGLASASNYETALKILRSLERKQREQFFSLEQENELIKNIRNSGKFALSEMRKTSASFDISNEIKYIAENIKGKDKNSALFNFVALPGHISFSKLEADSINFIKTSPLLSFFGHTTFGSDGRIISKTSGIDNFESLDSKNSAVWNNMIWQYMLHISCIVQSAILPALQIIRCEHNIQLTDMIQIVQKSNIIPIDRIAIFAKGLYAGFSYDFMTSLHLLSPQVENMVRIQLQEAGVRTTIIENGTDVEQEIGFSKLVEKEKFEDIFGKDLSFELKALFCDGAGPNLRNNVAHGLLSSYEMNSVYSVYCWWLCFKLVFINFYNAEREEVKK